MQSSGYLINLYRTKGLRITPQRRLIFELLANNDSHPTVDELYRQIKKQMPEVSRATVYNTLHELVALDELQEVEGLSKEGTRYDSRNEHHHHLYCQNCNKLIDITYDLGSIELPPGKFPGYKIQRHQVTFYGICPDCQN